jgi:hypothetical protein
MPWIGSGPRATVPRCVVSIGDQHDERENVSAQPGDLHGDICRLLSSIDRAAIRKTDRNDWNDAAAICEAAPRPTMRFVATKSLEQRDLLAIYRIRECLVSQRTGLCDQIRGLLAEYGIVLPQAVTRLRRGLPQVLEDAENEVNVRAECTSSCYANPTTSDIFHYRFFRHSLV